MSDDKRFIDYYFCLNSPWVYLAKKRLEEIAASNQATIQYFPVDLREMMLRLIGHDDPPSPRLRLIDLRQVPFEECENVGLSVRAFFRGRDRHPRSISATADVLPQTLL